MYGSMSPPSFYAVVVSLLPDMCCEARLASCGTLCGEVRRLRKHCRIRGRIGDLFLSDDHCVRHQSQKAGTIHRICGVLIATYYTSKHRCQA